MTWWTWTWWTRTCKIQFHVYLIKVVISRTCLEPLVLLRLNQSSQPPRLNERNGKILGYYIRYGQLGSETLSKKTIRDNENLQVLDQSITIHTSSPQTIISGLAPFSKYSVTVSPFTSAGPGPSSSKSVVATLEGGELCRSKVENSAG